jgi:Glyoxalase-like domain
VGFARLAGRRLVASVTAVAYTFQTVIDCTDPHLLAEWWAATLGWQVESQDEAFIRSMIEQGHASDADTRTYRGALVWREAAAIHPHEEKSPARSRILFQEVPEAKSVKNRVHLDIRIGDDDPRMVRERLIARGATVIHTGQQGPNTWLTMADPEGNEFCV